MMILFETFVRIVTKDGTAQKDEISRRLNVEEAKWEEGPLEWGEGVTESKVGVAES